MVAEIVLLYADAERLQGAQIVWTFQTKFRI